MKKKTFILIYFLSLFFFAEKKSISFLADVSSSDHPVVKKILEHENLDGKGRGFILKANDNGENIYFKCFQATSKNIYEFWLNLIYSTQELAGKVYIKNFPEHFKGFIGSANNFDNEKSIVIVNDPLLIIAYDPDFGNIIKGIGLKYNMQYKNFITNEFIVDDSEQLNSLLDDWFDDVPLNDSLVIYKNLNSKGEGFKLNDHTAYKSKYPAVYEQWLSDLVYSIQYGIHYNCNNVTGVAQSYYLLKKIYFKPVYQKNTDGEVSFGLQKKREECCIRTRFVVEESFSIYRYFFTIDADEVFNSLTW